MTDVSTLGERITFILNKEKIKKVDFAKSLGISANYVSLLAGGKKTAVSDTLAILIETLYGYRREWVLSGELPIQAGVSPFTLKNEIIDELNRMDFTGLVTVSQFLDSLGKQNV